MKGTFSIAVVLGLAFAAALPAQNEAGVQEAIRFERAKDAADARQARIEAQRANAPTRTESQAVAGETRAMGSEANAVGDRTKIEHGVNDAIAFERSKDAADARQARMEARQQGTVASADRMKPKK